MPGRRRRLLPRGVDGYPACRAVVGGTGISPHGRRFHARRAHQPPRAGGRSGARTRGAAGEPAAAPRAPARGPADPRAARPGRARPRPGGPPPGALGSLGRRPRYINTAISMCAVAALLVALVVVSL